MTDVNKNDEINIEEYKFSDLPPIKGYPELRWQGKKPYTRTRFYPAQLKETYGKADENGWINKIFWGDNLQVMSHMLKKFRGKVDLVYIDPPFDSKADYKKTIALRGKKAQNDHTAFEEKQYGDMWNNDEYLQFMYERLILIRELLSEKGTIYLHCDFHKSHHLRCLMDEVFGSDCFIREVIWWFDNVSGFKSIADNWIRDHETIFWYKKAAPYTFNKVYGEYPEGYEKKFSNIDENGRRFMKRNGRRQYLDELKGKPLGDVWRIPFINNMSNERLDYPTQKPEALLERIIKASSNPGDLVFDCFMGSGTTQAVAMKLGRRFIGADINLGAVETTIKRLNACIKDGDLLDNKQAGFEYYNVNNYDVFRNPIEAKSILVEALELNPLMNNNVFDGEKDGYKYKILSVNRIANKEDLNDIIANIDYKSLEKSKEVVSNKPLEKICLVCMGHEPDLAAELTKHFKVSGYNVEVQILDILRDNKDLEFKRLSEAVIVRKDGNLVIKDFFPMNLLQKLSMQKGNVSDWKELVESVKIDWNYDGAVFNPLVVDYPEDKKDMVKGSYKIPEDAGRIKIKITDLLAESYEAELDWS